ncbi:MAG: 4Fe-4S dicluster domain-containing protein [Candidatus Promineifilaceae bacterium]|nr:4Fe-4S dicluster domain-containing protein [Candidatus Promineifilaceae bacterium]
MARWAMVIDLDKCVACQGCSIACRFENNTPAVKPSEALKGRAIRWNDVFPIPINPEEEESEEYPNVKTRYLTRPCMHCANPPCIKVCPVRATYKDEEGLVRQNYDRCIGCRFCTVACPYGVRYFNWHKPEWDGELAEANNPDRLEGQGVLEGPAVRPLGVVEKCTFCIHRLHKARARAEAEGRELRSEDYIPACVETCTGKARFFGDLDDPESIVSQFEQSPRAFRLLEDVGTHPKVIYLREG